MTALNDPDVTDPDLSQPRLAEPDVTESGASEADRGKSVAAVTVENVDVAFGRGEPVVRAVSVQVTKGEWLAVIGPNGAGKSTLLKAIAGLVEHGGTVTFGPESSAPTPQPASARVVPGRARTVAYLAQRPTLPSGMTVAEYVLLGRTVHLRWLESEGRRDRSIVDQVLERLSLSGFAARPLTELSGGEVQRVSLARALAQEAPVLLLDEPTSALDIGHQIGVLELVDELRRERDLTVITAMHDLTTAGRFADRLALLHEGALVAAGPVIEVLTEEILSRFYGTPVEVLDAADGGIVIVPLRRRTPPAADRR